MVKINLIPETIQRAQTRRQHSRCWVASILASAVILAIPLTIDRVQRAEAVELAKQCSQLDQELEAVQTKVESLSARAGETRRRLERAIALRAKRPWSAMFTMIEERMPDDCWLVSVATDPPAPRGGRTAFVASHSGPTTSAVAPGEEGATANDEVVVVIEAPRKLVVSGYTLDAADPHVFVNALKGAEVFTDVALEQVRGEMLGSHPCFRFELICEW